MSDYNLQFSNEAEWLDNQTLYVGECDVIGEYNGKFLVNIRGSVDDALLPFNVLPVTPLRVWY